MNRGIVVALLAALLFGATTPIVKALTVDVGANAGAALLYLGSGLGLLALLLIKRARRHAIAPIPTDARLRFAGAVVAGGVVAPVLLLLGLRATSAATSSLLLNLEGVFTAGIAWLVFKENVDRRVFLGMLAIVAGGALLSFDGSTSTVGIDVGALCVIGACLGWGIDNNLTQAASSADAFVVAGVKGFVAGIVNLVVAIVLAQAFPSTSTAALLMVVGFLGYGLSLALFVVALRSLGSARTGAYFGAAPFIGVVVAVVAFGEMPTLLLLVAGVLMGIGLWLHVSEHHEHAHHHDALEHEHEHEHDEHHQHVHDDGVVVVGKHTHRHLHAPLVHTHAHVPDLHHRHGH